MLSFFIHLPLAFHDGKHIMEPNLQNLLLISDFLSWVFSGRLHFHQGFLFRLTPAVNILHIYTAKYPVNAFFVFSLKPSHEVQDFVLVNVNPDFQPLSDDHQVYCLDLIFVLQRCKILKIVQDKLFYILIIALWKNTFSHRT